MTRAAGPWGLRLLAGGLAVACIVGAQRAASRVTVCPTGPGPWGSGWFGEARATDARLRLTAALEGLASLAEPDGGFALWAAADRPSPPEPEVRRAASSALAAWAFVEALGSGAEAPAELLRVRERALDYLERVQKADGRGGFGLLAPNALGAPDPGPSTTALAAGALALAGRRDPARAVAAGQAARALAGVAAAGVRDGWLRALVAMALDGLIASGRQADLGARGRGLLSPGQAPANPDCGDFRLAEALVRVLGGALAAGDLFPEQVVSVCLTQEPLTWNGQGTDLASWLMQAWLAARSRQAPAWFQAALPALDEALGPDGLVPQSVYADRVAQTACAVLLLVEGLRGPARGDLK